MDPVGIQSGSSRDAVGHQFCIFWHRFRPVGIQSGSTNFAVFGITFWPVGKQLNHPKTCQNSAKMLFFKQISRDFRGFATGGRNCKIGAGLDPDWPKAAPKKCKIGARNLPDWTIGSRLAFLEKTLSTPLFCKIRAPISKNLAPCRAPPKKRHPTSLKPNTGNPMTN